MLHRSSHRWKHKRKAFFGIFRSSPIAFDLMSSMVANRNSSPRKAFLSSPNHRTLRISLQVTFGCSLLWKWASRGHVSHPWRTSNRMQRPNSGRFWKKPSAGASNSSRIDGASVCVCVCVCVRARARVLLWRWLGKRCNMSYHFSAIPHFRELFDCPTYTYPIGNASPYPCRHGFLTQLHLSPIYFNWNSSVTGHKLLSVILLAPFWPRSQQFPGNI